MLIAGLLAAWAAGKFGSDWDVVTTAGMPDVVTTNFELWGTITFFAIVGSHCLSSARYRSPIWAATLNPTCTSCRRCGLNAGLVGSCRNADTNCPDVQPATVSADGRRAPSMSMTLAYGAHRSSFFLSATDFALRGSNQ